MTRILSNRRCRERTLGRHGVRVVELDLTALSHRNDDVIKRDVVEGEKADQAKRQISRAASRALRAKSPKDDKTDASPEVIDVAPIAGPPTAAVADD